MLFRTVVLLTCSVKLLMKGVGTGRVTGDCYRGVICLRGPCEIREDHEDETNDD